VYAEWASNEKVAVDVAIGAAYAGQRSFSSMKHVGLNVAADAFMYASMTGAEAGLVIVSADDPGMHSSQNEQDNRTFAKFARIPCLEPSDSQEAKDLMIAAFGLSERFDTPVLLRMTTRVCHSMSAVELGERVEAADSDSDRKFPRNPSKYVMVPGNAIQRHPVIEQRMRDVADLAETFPFNHIEAGDPELGIITAGVAYQYAKEIFPNASILHLGMTWPLPEQLIRRFAASVKRLIVIEELDPFIEAVLNGVAEGRHLPVWVNSPAHRAEAPSGRAAAGKLPMSAVGSRVGQLLLARGALPWLSHRSAACAQLSSRCQ
jgi:indolepyruvate ferredoxin oxidoreductase alpha subunit